MSNPHHINSIPSSTVNNTSNNQNQQLPQFLKNNLKILQQQTKELPIPTQQQIQLDWVIAQRLLFNHQNNLIQEGGSGSIALRLAAAFAAATGPLGNLKVGN